MTNITKTEIRCLIEFIVTATLFYIAFTCSFNLPLINIIIGIVAVFVLFQGLEDVDTISGYGQSNEKNK